MELRRLVAKRLPTRSERGTLAMAMIVLMVCAATAGVLVARNVSTAHQAVEATRRSEALAAAEAGLSGARAHIAVGEAPATLSGTVGDATWTADLAGTAPGTFEVTAKGTSEDWSRTVQATVVVDGRDVRIENWHQVSGSS